MVRVKVRFRVRIKVVFYVRVKDSVRRFKEINVRQNDPPDFKSRDPLTRRDQTQPPLQIADVERLERMYE